MKRKWLTPSFNKAVYRVVMWVLTHTPILRTKLELFLDRKLGEISDFLLIRSTAFPQRGVVKQLYAKSELYRELVARHHKRGKDMCYECINEITCFVLHVCSKYPNQLFLWDKKKRNV